MEPHEPAPVDGRELRCSQGTIAVLILGGFVFRMPVLVAVATVFSAIGAFFGPTAHPVHVVFRAVVAPRIGPPPTWETPESVRALDILAALLCGLATIAFAGGVGGIAWIIALAEAAVATVAATTGANAALLLRERFRRDR